MITHDKCFLVVAEYGEISFVHISGCYFYSGFDIAEKLKVRYGWLKMCKSFFGKCRSDQGDFELFTYDN